MTITENTYVSTYDELKQACKNVGCDLDCGACVSIFFTGSTQTAHSCKSNTIATAWPSTCRSSTAKVRIAVAINEKSEWNAMGFFKWGDSESANCAKEGLDEPSENEVVHFVEVDVPIPVSLTLQGKIDPQAEVSTSPAST